MERTLRTDEQVVLQVLLPDDVLAISTLRKQTFGLDSALFICRCMDWFLIPFEPTHPVHDSGNIGERAIHPGKTRSHQPSAMSQYNDPRP